MDPNNRPLTNHHLAEVRNPREVAQNLINQPQMRAANFLVRIKHHHLVKESIHIRTKRGNQRQRLGVAASLPQRSHLRRMSRGAECS